VVATVLRAVDWVVASIIAIEIVAGIHLRP
jgi:hypothetical protein